MMETLNINATPVFEKNYEALFNSDKRFIINMGGSRSSKTYSLCQLLIVWALQNDNKVISIVRKTFPALRATVMRDFFEVLNDFKLYDEKLHNKTEHIYTFPNGTKIEFFSVDDEQKIRGRKRDILWGNEANELFFEDFQQLNMRTAFKVIADFNPSENYSWLYDLDPDDTITIHSTYKDNPFLPAAIAKQIEDLKHTDEAMYTIFALGKKAITKENIYNHFKFIDKKPKGFDKFIYGIDFGYTHPMALVKIWYNDNNEVYIEGLLYESYLTSSDLVSRLDALGIDKNIEIVCDYARPEIMAEMTNAGYYTTNANKTVQKGINAVKTTKVLCQNNPDLEKEYMNYRYKKINGRITEEPIKILDDYMDGIRYTILYIKENYSSSTGIEVFGFGR